MKGILDMTITRKTVATAMLLLLPALTFAGYGTVDYSYGVNGVYYAYEYVLYTMSALIAVCFVIGAIVALVGSAQVYWKIQHGEEGIRKEIERLCYSCLFLLFATVVLPLIYGFNAAGLSTSSGTIGLTW